MPGVFKINKKMAAQKINLRRYKIFYHEQAGVRVKQAWSRKHENFS